MATNSTNYSELYPDILTDVLLLESGDELLLENGTDAILLEDIELTSTNFSSSSTNSTNFSEQAAS